MSQAKQPKRNWPKYNEAVVQRGKNSRPFGYPYSLILFLGTLRVVFHLPYRQLEELAKRAGSRRWAMAGAGWPRPSFRALRPLWGGGAGQEV